MARPSTAASSTNRGRLRVRKAASSKARARKKQPSHRRMVWRYPIRSVRRPQGSSPASDAAEITACKRKNCPALTPAVVRTSSATGAKKTSPSKKDSKSRPSGRRPAESVQFIASNPHSVTAKEGHTTRYVRRSAVSVLGLSCKTHHKCSFPQAGIEYALIIPPGPPSGKGNRLTSGAKKVTLLCVHDKTSRNRGR